MRLYASMTRDLRTTFVASNGRVELEEDGVVNDDAGYFDATGVLVTEGEVFELTRGAVDGRDEGMAGMTGEEGGRVERALRRPRRPMSRFRVAM